MKSNPSRKLPVIRPSRPKRGIIIRTGTPIFLSRGYWIASKSWEHSRQTTKKNIVNRRPPLVSNRTAWIANGIAGFFGTLEIMGSQFGRTGGSEGGLLLRWPEFRTKFRGTALKQTASVFT